MLVGVELRGVDVPVSCGEGAEDGGNALLACGLEDAEAKTGDDYVAVGDGEGGCYCEFLRGHFGREMDFKSYSPAGASREWKREWTREWKS